MSAVRTKAVRRRERVALLVSFNLHLWVLVALAAHVWSPTPPEPEPEFLQVERIVLPPPPAPEPGQVAALPSPEQREPEKLQPEKRRSMERQTRPQPAVLPPAAQPQVRWSFTVSEPLSPARRQELKLLSLRDEDLSHCLQEAARKQSAQDLAQAPDSSRERARSEAVVDPAPEDLPFHAHDGAERPRHLPQVGEPGGSQLALIESIQRRIDAVSPVVHRTAWGCRAFGGQARLRFLMNDRGYPVGYQLLDSTGSGCLDAQIDTVLHLAEPYPRVAGWVPVRVTFRRRGS